MKILKIISENILLKKHPDITKAVSNAEKALKSIGNREGYQKQLYTKSFIDRFRIFEEYIFKFFTTIGLEFSYVLLNNKEKIEISISDINSAKNTVALKEILIQQEINNILFSENLVNAILKLKRVFSLDFEFSPEEKKTITIISFLRNIIIHNGGKLNRNSESKLKKLGYNIPIKLNESVITYIKKNEKSLSNTLGDFIVKLHKNIEKNLQQLEHYNKSLSK
ncbi:hypothetical protein [Leptospira meyeri]|uniref:hypothetical protein n=1 Tax=Leptospira meyeri TaxID=29508 RepID=UPI0010847AD2|nr:hypothetical protein [Leptospira meyeri]TGM60098.1 hypothetical protein EHQ93_17965 [Leptospira meyeri]